MATVFRRRVFTTWGAVLLVAAPTKLVPLALWHQVAVPKSDGLLYVDGTKLSELTRQTVCLAQHTTRRKGGDQGDHGCLPSGPISTCKEACVNARLACQLKMSTRCCRNCGEQQWNEVSEATSAAGLVGTGGSRVLDAQSCMQRTSDQHVEPAVVVNNS